MVILWFAHGYDSYSHKEKQKVFDSLDDAKQFIIGLTDSSIYGFNGKTYLKAINELLTSVSFNYKARLNHV